MVCPKTAISKKTYGCVRLKQRRDKERREMSNQRGIRIVELTRLTPELRKHII
jgi:hypothetical protein